MWSTEEGVVESDLKESSRGETGKRKLPQQTDTGKGHLASGETLFCCCFVSISKARYGVFSVFANFFCSGQSSHSLSPFIQLTSHMHLFYQLHEGGDFVFISTSSMPTTVPVIGSCPK